MSGDQPREPAAVLPPLASSQRDQTPRWLLWSGKSRPGVLGVVIITIGWLAAQRHRAPVQFADPAPAVGPRASELEDRLDPNTATAAELSSIPTLGEARAREMVLFREEFARAHPGDLAFKRPADLLALKGFGPSTVSNIERSLRFWQEPGT